MRKGPAPPALARRIGRADARARRIQSARLGERLDEVETTNDVASNVYEIGQQLVAACAQPNCRMHEPFPALSRDDR